MPKIANNAPSDYFEKNPDEKFNRFGNYHLEDSILRDDKPVSNLYPGRKGVYFACSEKNKTGRVLFILFGISLLLFGIWFLFVRSHGFSFISPFSKESPVSGSNNANKVMCDLTGEFFSQEEAASWKDERPLGVMVNNHVDARPQSGLIYADLVYEMVAEGGITRFLAFYLSKTPEKIGPVRSTREYYLVLVKELSDAMIMHIGYSPQALVAIDTWPVRSLFRGGCESYPGCTWRDNPRNVAYEHTAFVNGVVLRDLGKDLGWEGKGDIRVYSFKDNSDKYSLKPSVSQISIDFWSKGDYSSVFKYNLEKNTYLKFTGYDSNGQPIPHKDQETNEQIEIKNLIVQFVTETAIEGDEKGRLDYQLVGSGKSLVFIDGKVIDGTWSKASRDERTLFYDSDGKEMEFNRGKFWISIVPDRNADQVIYN